jgi:hypothetical protein
MKNGQLWARSGRRHLSAQHDGFLKTENWQLPTSQRLHFPRYRAAFRHGIGFSEN